MAGTDMYLGPPGAPVKLPGNIAPVESPLLIPTAQQATLDGGQVVNRMGRPRRRYVIPYAGLTADELGILERLILIGGSLVLDDPSRRNRLTANQSSGGDTSLTTDGIMARFQGTVARSTAQAHTGTGSFAWVTDGAVINRGLYLYSSDTTPDATWHPVRGGAWYAAAAYLRASAAINMYAGFDWMTAAGAYISTSTFGTSTAVSTTDFNTRVERTGVQAAANAAYGIPFWINATAPGARTVYLDDPQVEEVSGADVACGAYVIGTGVPRIAVVGVSASSPLLGYTSPGLELQEV
jgi:hypothetical protein